MANAPSPGGSSQEKEVETLLVRVLTSDEIPSNNRGMSSSANLPVRGRLLCFLPFAPRVLVESSYASLLPLCLRVPKPPT